MRITKIQVENFKRFTDLTIQYIPDTSKLVLLIGANGSGKSSLFDAFGHIGNVSKADSVKVNPIFQVDAYWTYFEKKNDVPFSIKVQFDHLGECIFSHTGSTFSKKQLPVNSFYGRTSFRQLPRLTRTALGQGGAVDFEKDTDRPASFIDRDNRFENDIEKMTETILNEFFMSNTSNEQIKEK